MTARDNFVISTDSDGKMPVLTPLGVPLSPSVGNTHKYWVEYINNKPVRVRPFPGQETAWDYSENKMLTISESAIKIVN